VFLIGTSGFSYDDWRGPFYPKSILDKDMLGFYAERFPMVEVNSTYYTVPSAESMRAMAAKVPEGFEFVVKAHGSITHERGPLARTLPPFLAAIDPIRQAGRLGALLFQCPGSFHIDDDGIGYLQELREALPPEWHAVVEFRHDSWLREETHAALTHMGVGFVNCDMPRLRGLLPPTDIVTSHISYVRFHGRKADAWYGAEEAWQRYDYLYSEKELDEWVPRLLDIGRRSRKTYVVFNNHPRGKSAENAQALRRKLAEAEPGMDFKTGLELMRKQTTLNGF
jgi:uncharacterized protein YecE (DUF72 family)